MVSRVKKLDSGKTTKVEKKRLQAQQNAAASFNIAEWFGGVKQEFKKITWTEKQELKAYTKIVIGATFLMGFAIFAVDLLIKNFIEGLETVVKLVIG